MKTSSTLLIVLVLAIIIFSCKDNHSPANPQTQTYLSIYEGRTETYIPDSTKNKVFTLKVSYTPDKQPYEITQYLPGLFGFPTFFSYRFNYNSARFVSSVEVRYWIYNYMYNFRTDSSGVIMKDVFTYDTHNNLINIVRTPTATSGQSQNPQKLYDFAYYSSNKLKRITRPYEDGTNYQAVFDENSGKLISMTGMQEINEKGLVMTSVQGTKYIYDTKDRLIRTDWSPVSQQDFYTYDDAQNPLNFIPLPKGIPEALRFAYPIAFYNGSLYSPKYFQNNITGFSTNSATPVANYIYTYNSQNLPIKYQFKNNTTGKIEYERYYKYIEQ